MIARLEAREIVLPGIASAHSHAFQRALRGRTHRRGGTFFGWRRLMYELVERMTPQDVYALSRFAYVELLRAGVTAVGEFHYVHHQPDGTPYARRTELADAVIRAALDAGIRITLLRVVYQRAGFGRPLEPAQRRFVDVKVEDALRDVDTLASAYAGEPRVTLGVAPHSVRAVPLDGLKEIARFADAQAIPVHMHVGEQRREVQETLAEHGVRPVSLLERAGLLSPRFVAVHATHLDAREVDALGASGGFVCVCRTTERDLGDGAPPLTELVRRGARLVFGVDSHALSDPFEEARAAELDERTRLERRTVLSPDLLLEGSTSLGYRALGLEAHDDAVFLDRGATELAGLTAPQLDDAVVFGASARAVSRVSVGGVEVVKDGRHASEAAARQGFDAALGRLGLGPIRPA